MRKDPHSLPGPVLCRRRLAALRTATRSRLAPSCKEGNRLYKDEAYKDALAQFQKGLAIDPTLTSAWRSVGLAAMALYRPGNESPGEPQVRRLPPSTRSRSTSRTTPTTRRSRTTSSRTWINPGRFDKAINYLKQQRTAHPENTKLTPAIVKVMIKGDRYQEALDGSQLVLRATTRRSTT